MFPRRTWLCQKLCLMFGLSPLHLSLVPVAKIPDGHACLGHARLPRVAVWLGRGWSCAPTELERGLGLVLRKKIFYLTCYEKLITQEDKH